MRLLTILADQSAFAAAPGTIESSGPLEPIATSPGGASPRTAITPVSQEGPTGSGTAVDPWLVTTTVDLRDSGVRLTQTDTPTSLGSTATSRGCGW